MKRHYYRNKRDTLTRTFHCYAMTNHLNFRCFPSLGLTTLVIGPTTLCATRPGHCWGPTPHEAGLDFKQGTSLPEADPTPLAQHCAFQGHGLHLRAVGWRGGLWGNVLGNPEVSASESHLSEGYLGGLFLNHLLSYRQFPGSHSPSHGKLSPWKDSRLLSDIFCCFCRPRTGLLGLLPYL